MAIRSVTYYQAFCDCCGVDADYGDYAAWSARHDAVEFVSDDWWCPGRFVTDPIYCLDCWAWAEDTPGYDPANHQPDDQVRKHPNGCKETHDDA